MNLKKSLLLALCAGLTGSVSAQVVLNEVHENPPGGGVDPFYEYIELYGFPGQSLDGFAVALLKGGTTDVVEIDEAFQLNGLVLGSNGLLVIYNDTLGTTLLPTFPAGTTVVTFTQRHIPTSDTAGNLANDDSSTYVLIRGRPATGTPPFASDWRKDVAHDVNFDGKIDFPFESGAAILEPYQMIDDIAWSHNAGREYTRRGTDQINETPGFNPDAITRLFYYSDNGPGPGLRADEEWINGDIVNNVGFAYDTVRANFPTGVSNAGARLTPGGFNDYGTVQQFRFVRGDFNFDGVVDSADGSLISAFVGRDIDETTPCTDSGGFPIIDPNTNQPYECFVFEGRLANALFAMKNMDTTDGPGGSNASFVTQADLNAWNNEFGTGPVCLGDIADDFGLTADEGGGPDGVVDFGDFAALLGLIGPCSGGTPGCLGDIADDFGLTADEGGGPDGVVDFGDFAALLGLIGPCN